MEQWLDGIVVGGIAYRRDDRVSGSKMSDGIRVDLGPIGLVLDRYRVLLAAAKSGLIEQGAPAPTHQSSASSVGTDLASDLALAKSQAATWKSEVMKLEQKIAEIQEENEKLRITVHVVQESRAQDRSQGGEENVRLLEANGNLLTQVSDLTGQLKECQARLAQAQNEADVAVASKRTLMGEFEFAVNRNTELEDRVSTLVSDNATLIQANNELEEKIAAMSGATGNAAYDPVVQRLERRVDRLYAALGSLMDKVSE
jgi:chromosome segregation ATPase